MDTRKAAILENYQYEPREFLNFVLDHYIKQGVGELDDRKLPDLLDLKYGTVHDAIAELGISDTGIREMFVGFQRHLYTPQEAA